MVEESVDIIVTRLEELGYLAPATSNEGAYDEEEEKEVEDRLRALGYI
jgi:hypothetical protein